MYNRLSYIIISIVNGVVEIIGVKAWFALGPAAPSRARCPHGYNIEVKCIHISTLGLRSHTFSGAG